MNNADHLKPKGLGGSVSLHITLPTSGIFNKAALFEKDMGRNMIYAHAQQACREGLFLEL